MAMPCGNEDGFFITIVTLPAFAVALFFVKASLPLTALIFSLVAAVATPATEPPTTAVTRTATAARRGETKGMHNLLRRGPAGAGRRRIVRMRRQNGSALPRRRTSAPVRIGDAARVRAAPQPARRASTGRRWTAAGRRAGSPSACRERRRRRAGTTGSAARAPVSVVRIVWVMVMGEMGSMDVSVGLEDHSFK